jgi:hypothetical protein
VPYREFVSRKQPVVAPRVGGQLVARPGLAASLPALLSCILVACAPLACGASIQSVYESNVRFEHCMALDAEPGVKAAIRRACWTEWLTFYTYGQTRDRVIHAQRRSQQLGVSGGPAAGGPVSGGPVSGDP